MNIQRINPLLDQRWSTFVTGQSCSSVFHTAAWLSALQKTYGYTPVAFADIDCNGQINSALLFCLVHSWVTGRRLVSVPFADHCDCLVSDHKVARELLAEVISESLRLRCGYVEIRPRLEWNNDESQSGLIPGDRYWFHSMSLDPDVSALFSGMHKDCIQRKIRRAEREHLSCETGRSDEVIKAFYKLLVGTRRRHELPPQPRAWFYNLRTELKEDFTIRIARQGDRAVAAVLTLSHKDTVMYKYGCSDESSNNLGGMPFLLWKTICDAKERGCECLDLGRSEADNAGLITFKNRLGATAKSLTYWRYSREQRSSERIHLPAIYPRRIFAHLPEPLLVACGRLLYRHVA